MLGNYFYLLLYVIILGSIQLASSDDHESKLSRLDEIDEIAENPGDIDPDDFVGLMREYVILLRDITSEPAEENDKDKDKEKLINSKVTNVLVCCHKQLIKLENPLDRRNLLNVAQRLRQFVADITFPNEIENVIKELDYDLLLNKLDELHGRLNESSSVQTQTINAKSMFRINQEYISLKSEARKKFGLDDNILKDKFKEIDNVLEVKSIQQLYTGLMKNYTEAKGLPDSVINRIKKLHSMSDDGVTELISRSPLIEDKLKEIQNLGSIQPNTFKCHIYYLDKVKKLKAKYEPELNISKYIDLMMSRQIGKCLEFIESNIRIHSRNNIRIEAAMARLGELREYLIEHVETDNTPVDENENRIDDIATHLVKYLQTLESKLNPHLYRSGVDEKLLSEFDGVFEIYIRRHCNEIESLSYPYDFVRQVKKESSVTLEFWTSELMYIGDICRKVKNTKGREWYLLFNACKRSPLKLSESADIETFQLFKMMGEILLAEPAMKKISPSHEELREMQTYRSILRFLKSPATEYQPEYIRRLRNIAESYNNKPVILNGLNQLRRTKINEIISIMRRSLITKSETIQPDAIEALGELRIGLEKEILREHGATVEDRIIQVFRPGISRGMIESQLETVRPKSRRARIDDSAGPSNKSSSDSKSELYTILGPACHQFVHDPVRLRIFSWYTVIQEQMDYELMSDGDVDFLIDYTICKNFPSK